MNDLAAQLTKWFGERPQWLQEGARRWGTGEPAGPPLPAQNPKQALNTLSGERLAKARKVWTEVGGAAYANEAKALCSDIRITIERLIELELLADVVQRFRRPRFRR